MPHGSATLVFSHDESAIASTLFGAMTKPACVGRTANACAMIFIVEFQPAGYYAFGQIPQKELADQIVSFASINPKLNSLIAQQLETAQEMGALIDAIDRLFFMHMKMECYQQEFLSANQMIIHSGGRMPVKEISQTVYYSERHLNRIFERQMGVSIKSFSRLVRSNQALRLLQCPSYSMLEICLKSGFYDVPHFIHDFKATCGVTPMEYRNHMSDFYSEIAKF